jgi:membrane protease YdiL (CAAX protease family)
MIGIDANWKRDALEGGAYGLAFIFINKLFPQFIIGVPHEVLFGLGGLTLTVCVVAPILEEIGFRGILYPTAGKQFGDNIAIIGTSLAFSLFHWAAYGLALTTAFVGAFFFGFVAAYIAKKQNSLMGVMVMHGIFNWWMINGTKMFFLG